MENRMGCVSLEFVEDAMVVCPSLIKSDLCDKNNTDHASPEELLTILHRSDLCDSKAEG